MVPSLVITDYLTEEYHLTMKLMWYWHFSSVFEMIYEFEIHILMTLEEVTQDIIYAGTSDRTPLKI